MDAVAEGLDHGSLFVADLVRQRKTKVFRMVYKARQAAVDWRGGKVLDVRTQVVAALPARSLNLFSSLVVTDQARPHKAQSKLPGS